MDPRVALCLDYLAPHVAQGAVAITGSVAIGHRKPRLAGARSKREAFAEDDRTPADLDLVIARRDAIAASVCASFLVSHYHPHADKLVLQLVDPRAKLHIDIFLDGTGAIADAQRGPNDWLVLADDDLLDHKLELLGRATVERPIDPKHVDDAIVLAKRLLRPPPVVAAETLAPNVYCTDITVQCERCAIDPDFALAAKAEIFAILGYV